MKRHEEALAAYDRALALDPNDWQTWQGQYVDLRALRRYGAAARAVLRSATLRATAEMAERRAR